MEFIKKAWNNQWKKWERKGQMGTLGKVILFAAFLLVFALIIYALSKRGGSAQSDVFDAMRGVG